MKLILLHGWTMAGDVFDPLIAALPGVSCLAPDLPGHGATGYPATIGGGAEMLTDLLADGPAVLVGWSMGALVAWEHIARQGTAQVRALISIDMSPRPLPDWPFGLSRQTAEGVRARSAAFYADWPGAAQAMAAALFASRDGAATMTRAQAAARIAARDPAVMVPFWDQILAADHRPTVAALRVPSLAIHGAESRVYPAGCANWLAEAAPRGQAAIIPGTGHAPILEAPAETAAAITDFLKDLP
ncbi:MAG: alpha/beta hydrolase [Pararhodobacter sp.]|nr:alpha/beta hydrolase [Pararhodobacter sp.]